MQKQLAAERDVEKRVLARLRLAWRRDRAGMLAKWIAEDLGFGKRDVRAALLRLEAQGRAEPESEGAPDTDTRWSFVSKSMAAFVRASRKNRDAGEHLAQKYGVGHLQGVDVYGNAEGVRVELYGLSEAQADAILAAAQAVGALDRAREVAAEDSSKNA